MKSVLLGSLCLLLVAVLSTAYASDEDLLIVNEDHTSELNDSALSLALAEGPYGELTATEKEGILFMAEEEKLAGDVYKTLNEKWNIRVFDNIGRAERTHEAAVNTLLERYSLPDPTKGAGEFSNVTLQKQGFEYRPEYLTHEKYDAIIRG